LSVMYSDIEGGEFAAYVVGEARLLWSPEGNKSQDPRFVLAGHWDDRQTPEDLSDDVWVKGNDRLSLDSPCMDAGSPPDDYLANISELDGHARQLCGRVDQGAFETGIGDATCDGRIDLDDFRQWNICQLPLSEDQTPLEHCRSFDFDFDGRIDLRDFSEIQNIWRIE